jgi:hypothetical protein
MIAIASLDSNSFTRLAIAGIARVRERRRGAPFSDPALDLLRKRDQVFRFGVERACCCSWTHTAMQTDEQRLTKVSFQLPNAGGHIGLHGVKQGACANETALFVHGHKELQVFYFHVLPAVRDEPFTYKLNREARTSDFYVMQHQSRQVQDSLATTPLLRCFV